MTDKTMTDPWGQLRKYDDQFGQLRRWCEELTGIDTNTVIGSEGWPNTIVECVIKAVDEHMDAINIDEWDRSR